MDEQIKPVAWRAKTPHGWVVGKTQHSSYDEPLYSQQSIDALRAELAEQCRLHAIGMERELALIGRAERAEAEAESLRAQLRGIQQDALELYEQIPQLPVTIHTLDAATDAFTRFCIDFSEHIDAARKGAE